MSAAEAVQEGCSLRMLCPFDIHFSQTRIRAEFQDGRSVQDATDAIKVIPMVARNDSADQDTDASDTENMEPNKARQDQTSEETLMLSCPFPRIEVTKWRCKLREADGTARLDPATGLELYSKEERWFSFDNRRLYCMQRAATKSWPSKILCEVVVVPHALAKQRELRKFDTKTFGYSVMVGRRTDESPENWCWRTAVGLPQAMQPEDGVARQRSNRWRAANARQGYRGDPRGKRYSQDDDDDEEEEQGGFFRSVVLCFAIYLVLRILMLTVKYYWPKASASLSASGIMQNLQEAPSVSSVGADADAAAVQAQLSSLQGAASEPSVTASAAQAATEGALMDS
eukprot:TRINITY_DN19850_c0_g1_i1.p1 TRINITY_DN19850_c0_g1~~TRINITY_DN19850_c0_g1_i1.p1  ORF type:complete len:342 (-),score=37.33 TRINITY_DN19850_c0_g1_i1:121-1146(-)